MKKYMDKLKKCIYINKNLFIFLLILVIIGISAGTIFSVVISASDKELVRNYLNEFFNNIVNNKLNYNNSFLNTLVFTLGLALLIWLLGISVIGFLIIIFLLFLKSFIIGFSLGSILLTFKLKGILYAIIYIFPHSIINLFVFMYLSAHALIISYKLISSLKSKKPIEFKYIMNRYSIVLIFSLIVLLLSGIYEIYCLPNVLRCLLTFLK